MIVTDFNYVHFRVGKLITIMALVAIQTDFNYVHFRAVKSLTIVMALFAIQAHWKRRVAAFAADKSAVVGRRGKHKNNNSNKINRKAQLKSMAISSSATKAAAAAADTCKHEVTSGRKKRGRQTRQRQLGPKDGGWQ